MNASVLLRAVAGALTYMLLSSAAMAQATVKVGVIASRVRWRLTGSRSRPG
jgi:hypothetical protein